MRKKRSPVSVFAVTAGLLGAYYLLNQKSGRRNRAEVRNRLRHFQRKSLVGLERGLQDALHRFEGVIAELRGRVSEREVEDSVLRERVRATLGHYTSHPGAIRTQAKKGTVILEGPVFRNEQRGIVRAIKQVRGVRKVENKLNAVEDASNEPSLQGDGKLPAHPPFMRTYWPPAYRLGLGAAGAMMYLASLRRRGPSAWGLGSAGIGLATRALTNRSIASLLGFGDVPAVSVRKAIRIEEKIDKVFDLWQHPENFPSFMRFVRDVHKLPDGGYLWTVCGPAETNVKWIADLTVVEPNRRIVWKSRPGSTIDNRGKVTFERQSDGSTVVHVSLDYSPPAGAIGHIVASLFGADPKSEIDSDLARMKTLLETGIPPADAARPQMIAGLKKNQ